MITGTTLSRRAFVTSAAGFVSAAFAALPAQAQIGQNLFSVAPPSVPFAAPPPQSDTLRGEEFIAPPPFSRIRQDAQGNSDSTAGVNYLTAVSPFTQNAPDDIWLGTQYGIKRVTGKSVRYYFQEAGLPGDYIEAIAGNRDDGFALVRVGVETPLFSEKPDPARLAFCVWDKKTDTWRTSHTINSLGLHPFTFGYDEETRHVLQENGPQIGRGVLADTADFAAFASGIVSRDETALFYLWDKKTQTVRPIAWESGLKENAAPFVGIAFLHFDTGHQRLWVGTSQGIYSYHLQNQAWDAPVLPGYRISAGAATPDKSALYVAARLPAPLLPRPNPNAPRPRPAQDAAHGWRLVRVDLATRQADEMPPPSGFAYGIRPFQNIFEPAPNEPASLFADGQKVWASMDTTLPSGGSKDDPPGGIECFDQTAQTWEHIALAPPRSRLRQARMRRNAQSPGPLFPIVPDAAPFPAPDAPDPVLVRLDTVPDAVLVPFVLTQTAEQYPYQTNPALPAPITIDGWSFESIAPPAYWIRHRFPAWYGPHDAALVQSGAARYAPQIIAEPFGPDKGKRFWYINGDTVENAPRPPRVLTEGAVSGAETQKFPFAARLAAQSFPVYRIVPAGPQNPGVLVVQTRQALYAVDTDKNTWTPINLGDNGTSVSASYAKDLLPRENRRPVFQTSYNGATGVRFWREADQTFDADTPLPLPKNTRLLGTGKNDALWLITNDYDDNPHRVYYQPASPGAPAPAPAPMLLDPPPPDTWTPYHAEQWKQYLFAPFAAWGSRAWYAVLMDASGSPKNAITGYDIVSQKWTPPLLLEHTLGRDVPLLYDNGVTYAAADAGNPDGCVWELGENQRAWRVIAPPLPPESEKFEDDAQLRRVVLPVSVTGDAVWVLVTGRMMARYDRTAQKWETFPLPPALRDLPKTDYGTGREPKAVRLDADTFCACSERGGLWRLRVAQSKNGLTGTRETTGKWNAVAQTTTLRSHQETGTYSFRLANLTVTPQYVWATGSLHNQQFSFVGRMDKSTGKWEAWDERSGVPTHGYFSDMAADGDAVWVNNPSGTYRFAPKTNQWMLMTRGTKRSEPDTPRVPEQAALFGDKQKPVVGNVVAMASDEKSVFLLFGGVPDAPPVPAPENAPVWRWDKAAQTLSPLPFPAGFVTTAASPSELFASALQSDPQVLWVGNRDGVFAWDKKRQKWDKPAFPAGIPFVAPQYLGRSAGADGALLLFGRSSGFVPSHVIRLVSPPFGLSLKQP